ncbi:MAG: toxic anion resistance protein, partial [Oscillospiraceae bacterium]
MTDSEFVPQLTLDPTVPETETATAVAAATAKAPEALNLTVDPAAAAPVADEAALQKERDANAVKLDESQLTDAERKMVDEFASKIDITDSNVVLQYGAAAQKNVAGFSESTLNSVRTKDLGEVGEALSSLVVELKGCDVEDKKGIRGFFQKKRNEMEEMKASYNKAEVNVDKIS